MDPDPAGSYPNPGHTGPGSDPQHSGFELQHGQPRLDSQVAPLGHQAKRYLRQEVPGALPWTVQNPAATFLITLGIVLLVIVVVLAAAGAASS